MPRTGGQEESGEQADAGLQQGQGVQGNLRNIVSQTLQQGGGTQGGTPAPRVGETIDVGGVQAEVIDVAPDGRVKVRAPDGRIAIINRGQ